MLHLFFRPRRPSPAWLPLVAHVGRWTPPGGIHFAVVLDPATGIVTALVRARGGPREVVATFRPGTAIEGVYPTLMAAAVRAQIEADADAASLAAAGERFERAVGREGRR